MNKLSNIHGLINEIKSCFEMKKPKESTKTSFKKKKKHTHTQAQTVTFATL